MKVHAQVVDSFSSRERAEGSLSIIIIIDVSISLCLSEIYISFSSSHLSPRNLPFGLLSPASAQHIGQKPQPPRPYRYDYNLIFSCYNVAPGLKS